MIYLKNSIPTEASCYIQGSKVFVDFKMIGEIHDRSFIKRVQGSKHFLRKPAGIAIQQHAYNLIKDAVDMVEVYDTETGNVFRTSIGTFATVGKVIERNYGKQIVLPFKYWTTELTGQMRLI